MTIADKSRKVMAKCCLQFRDLVRNTKGNTLMILGLSMVPLIGTVGIGVDVAQWNLWKRQLHSAADLAALAGAAANLDGLNADAAARRALELNNLRQFNIVAVETPPSEGDFAGEAEAVRVVLSTQDALPFSGLFLDTAPVVMADAVAMAGFEVPQCVIALDTALTSPPPLSISGSASVDMNCGIGSNGNFDATSSDRINAGALSAVGTVNSSGNITGTTRVNDGIAPITDPYDGLLPEPDLTTTCSGASNVRVTTNQVVTLAPGCYTDMRIQGRLFLQPGTYFIDGGDLELVGQGYIEGTGVTIILTNSSTASGASIGVFDFAGTSTSRLSAPTTGDYAGVVLMQDARATSGQTSLINGTSGTDASGNTVTSNLEGAIYAPSSEIRFNGNSSLTSDCMQLIGWNVTFTGNTTVSNNCPPGLGVAAFAGVQNLRLVM